MLYLREIEFDGTVSLQDPQLSSHQSPVSDISRNIRLVTIFHEKNVVVLSKAVVPKK